MLSYWRKFEMKKKNNSFKEIWDKLKKCKRVAMTLHYGPDGDSLGSCGAMKYVLEREFGCKVTLVSNHDLSENLKGYDFVREIEFGKDVSELNGADYDAFVFVDGGAIGYYSGKLKDKYLGPNETIVINLDHHASNTYFGDLNYVDIESPAACSVLVDLFRSQNVKFDRELSNRLLIGVFTDSGFFTYDTGPKKALEDALFLINNGADYLNYILRPILYNQPLKMKKYLGILFTNLKSSGKVGYSSISHKDIKGLGLNESEVRLGVNELQFIKEFDLIFTLSEMGDYIKGSFRTKKGIDVSEYAKALGGGGHKAAAAFFLDKMPLDKAEKKVLEAIEKVRNSKKD